MTSLRQLRLAALGPRSLRRAALTVGVSPSWLSLLERDRTTDRPSWGLVVRLARLYDVDPVELGASLGVASPAAREALRDPAVLLRLAGR